MIQDFSVIEFIEFVIIIAIGIKGLCWLDDLYTKKVQKGYCYAC